MKGHKFDVLITSCQGTRSMKFRAKILSEDPESKIMVLKWENQIIDTSINITSESDDNDDGLEPTNDFIGHLVDDSDATIWTNPPSENSPAPEDQIDSPKSDELSTVCYCCGKVYRSKYAVNRHVKECHTNEYAATCQRCRKTFKRMYQYTRHIYKCR